MEHWNIGIMGKKEKTEYGRQENDAFEHPCWQKKFNEASRRNERRKRKYDGSGGNFVGCSSQ
jgi:hypothetical protein